MKVRQLILNCDFLGRTQPFTIAKKNYYQTYIGSFLSFVIVIVCTYFILSIGLATVKHKNPNVVHTTYSDENPSKILLTKNNFVFSLGLQNADYSLYVNESIYNIKFSIVSLYRTGDGNTETNVRQIPLHRCTENNFTILNEYFALMDLANLYCVNTEEDLYLEGEFGQEKWTYFDFQFNKCVNTTENNNTCMSSEEIANRLDGGYMGVFMNDITILPKNYKEPSHMFGKNVFTTFSAREYADIWIYIKRLEVSTDNGFIFDSVHTKSYFAYESLQVQKDYRNANNFLSVKVRLSQSREVYDRSYDKLQTIAADLGGIMKVCLIVGKVLVYYFREFLYCDFIMSFYMKEEEENKINKTKVSNLFSSIKFANINNSNMIDSAKNRPLDTMKSKSNKNLYKVMKDSSMISIFSSKSNLFKENKTTTIKWKQSFDRNLLPQRHLHFSFWDLLGPCLVNSHIKKKLRFILSEFSSLSFLFDIINYLKINNDLKYIKTNIFDEYQNHLMLYKYKFSKRSQLESVIFENVVHPSASKVKKYK